MLADSAVSGSKVSDPSGGYLAFSSASSVPKAGHFTQVSSRGASSASRYFTASDRYHGATYVNGGSSSTTSRSFKRGSTNTGKSPGSSRTVKFALGVLLPRMPPLPPTEVSAGLNRQARSVSTSLSPLVSS